MSPECFTLKDNEVPERDKRQQQVKYLGIETRNLS